jgi:predicted aspartyl protease
MRNSAVLLVLLLAACRLDGEPGRVDAPADAAAGEVPFELMQPGETAMLVPVHINGAGPYELVFDTGATLTCVSTALADELQLRDLPGAVGMGAGVIGSGRIRIVRFDSLRVGNAVAHDIPGCVLDLTGLEAMGSPVQGLLGLNFMQQFDVNLDFRRGVVGFTGRD